jgi:transposase
MTRAKHIGMDVHKESISIAVVNFAGKVVMECVIETKASSILQFIHGLRGDLQVTFEEGTWAGWLYDLLKPHVTELAVCNPRKSALLKDGSKSDRIDARKLADLLYMNKIKPVYHGEHSLRMLKELSRSYLTISKDLGRVMNRLQQARKELLAEARKHRATKLLRQIPGIGPLRAAHLVAVMQMPHRFRTKRQLWTYSGLGLETYDSAQYRVVEQQLQRSKKSVTLRGLNTNHNHDLKDIFKGAAMRASTAAGPLRDFYEALLAKGRKPTMARLTLARKIAAITLIVWKKEVRFDANYLKPQAA